MTESACPYVDSGLLNDICLDYLIDDKGQPITFETLVQLTADEIAAGRLLDPKTHDEDDCYDSFLDFVCDHIDLDAYSEDMAGEDGVDLDDDDEYEEWFDTDEAANLTTDAADAVIYELIYTLK